jgi:hypothetical protein
MSSITRKVLSSIGVIAGITVGSGTAIEAPPDAPPH